jgi:hypothetical protein
MNACQEDLTYSKNIKNIFKDYNKNKNEEDLNYEIYKIYNSNNNNNAQFTFPNLQAHIWDLTLELDFDLDFDLNLNLDLNINDILFGLNIITRINNSRYGALFMNYNLFFASLFNKKIIINYNKYLIPLVCFDLFKIDKFNINNLKITILLNKYILKYKPCLTFKYNSNKILDRKVLSTYSFRIVSTEKLNTTFNTINLVDHNTKFLLFECLSVNKEKYLNDNILLDKIIIKNNNNLNKEVITFDINLGEICVLKALNRYIYAINIDSKYFFKNYTLSVQYLLSNNDLCNNAYLNIVQVNFT